MRINSIQSYNNYVSKNSFGAVIYEPRLKIPTELASELKRAEKELANTKYWDLAIKQDNNENLYYYQNKSNPLEVLSGKAELLQWFEVAELLVGFHWIDKLTNGIEKVENEYLKLYFQSDEEVKNALITLKTSTEGNELGYAINAVKVLDSASEIQTELSDYYEQFD